MKELREALVLVGAQVDSLNRQHKKDGTTTLVLQISAPMSPEIADVLRCRNQCYTLNDNPYPNLGAFKLTHQISSCEMTVPTHKNLLPTVVTGFVVKVNGDADSDGSLEIQFRAKFSGTPSIVKELNRMCDSVKHDPFDVSFRALQENLFDGITEDSIGGTAVNMSPDDEDFDDEDEDDDSEDAEDEPLLQEAAPNTLASVQEMKRPRRGGAQVN